jgi:hypothetical protein
VLMPVDFRLGVGAQLEDLRGRQVHQVEDLGAHVLAAQVAAEPVRVKRVDGVGGHGAGPRLQG